MATFTQMATQTGVLSTPWILRYHSLCSACPMCAKMCCVDH